MSWKKGLAWTRAAEVLRSGTNTADVLGALNAISLSSGDDFSIYICHLPLLLMPEMRPTLLLCIPDLFSYLMHIWQLWSKTTFMIGRTCMEVRYTASHTLYWCDKMNFQCYHIFTRLLPVYWSALTVCFELLFFGSWSVSIQLLSISANGISSRHPVSLKSSWLMNNVWCMQVTSFEDQHVSAGDTGVPNCCFIVTPCWIWQVTAML